MLYQTLECPPQQFVDNDQPQSSNNQSDSQRSVSITMQAMAAREAIIVDDVADLSPNEIHRFTPEEALTGPFSCFPLLAGEGASPIGVLSVDACRKAHRLLPQAMSVDTLPRSVKYVLEVDFAARFEPPPEFHEFLEQAVAVAEQALQCVRGREARYSKRKLAVARNSQRFQSTGLNPSGDALRALQDIVTGIFDDVAESLPGVHVQIAELQAGGAQLKYSFTGNGSTVLGCTLNRGQGVSFKSLDTKQPLVVGPTSDLRARLQRIGIFRSQPGAVGDAFPFIFVPLFHEDCAIGVLSVDSFQNVPKGSTVIIRGGRYQHRLSPAKEVEVEALLQLQRDTISLIERSLSSPNIYFGMWEPALRILRYTSASKTSVMAGKKLKHGRGVSFLALEKQTPIVVTSQDAASEENDDEAYVKKLRYFTTEQFETRKWPFIAVPVGNLGVLALDNMESYEREAKEQQPELGVVDFLRKIGQSFAEVLTVVRERTFEERQRLRDEALVRVMSACENFKPTSSVTGTVSLYLPHLVIQHIENALNGVDAYIGMVDPLCERIRFICASSNSNMEKRTVDTCQSVSFRAFASQRTTVIPQLQQYFKQQKNLQQHDTEHGQKLKYFGRAESPRGPFVCVPIPFVGVLSVDSFPGASGGAFSPTFPEDGVVTFLEKVANCLGENIRTMAANDARKRLPTLFHGNRTTFPLLFSEVLAIISHNLFAVFELEAVCFERTDSAGHWRRKKLLASMKRSNNTRDSAEIHEEEEEALITQSLVDRLSQTSNDDIQSDETDEVAHTQVHQLPGRAETLVVHCSPTRDVDSDEAALAPTVLVLRRVKGATWMYDEEFLLSILPLINSLIAMVNVRVEGIVARRLVERELHELCRSLDSLPSSEAIDAMYATVLPSSMETLAQAMSRGNADVYLAERELTDRTKSRASQLQLRFVAASGQSRMKNVAINLEKDDDSLSLTVVQCLKTQKSAVVTLSRENSPVRQLTQKPAQRLFIVVPMGDNYVLCADSLGQEAIIPGKRQAVESDVISFFKRSASTLQETILSTRHRLSYDRLRRLTTLPHPDFRLFYTTILDGLRRDLVSVHSQQILTLGEDFTASFRLEAWQRSRTRRPMKTLPEHFCSVNCCQQELIEHESGTDAAFGRDGKAWEVHLRLPSDDAGCGDRFSSWRRKTCSRQYFFAFAAVVSDVYVHVFRACALETFATELFMTLQEYLDAKDGVVVRFDSSDRGQPAETGMAQTRAQGEDSVGDDDGQQTGKTSSRQPLRGKLERKAQQFEASNAPLTIFMTKKAIPAPTVKAPADPTSLSSDSKSKTAHDKQSKRRGPMSLFGGNKLFRYGKKKKIMEEQEKAKEQQQLMKSAAELQSLSPSRAQQLRRETVSLHVFLRVLNYRGRHNIIIFTVEKQSIKAASAVEKIIRNVKSRAENFAAEMMNNPPRGDEEVNAKRFCSAAASSSSDRGGGGFLLLSLLKRAQARFQEVEALFGGAMRQYLTGAQSTARDAHTNVSEGLTALFGNSSSKDDAGSESTSTPTTALLRVALVACALKRDTIMALSQTDLLKEYLRIQAGRKLVQLDPTDKKTWGALARARALLRSFDNVIHELNPHRDDSVEPVGATTEASWALHTLLDLLLAQSAVVRYLKFLEAEIARERRQFGDSPAITIQCFVRQTQARVELKRRRRQFHAALAIQCAFRQHLARRRVLFKKWNRAAIKIQRAFRRRRQRAKGSRPQRFTAQLLSASQQFGAMGRAPTVVANVADGSDGSDMAAFGSFQDYMASQVGREQLKKEQELMWRHHQEVEKERARLPREEALREDVGDLFELLDDAGSGELARARTTALITRLHVPLNEEEVADVVAMMDSDGSGGISMNEFMRWFAHEFPLLQKRAPRVCGVVTRRDWQWVIEQSARSAILKRWRAMRAGTNATASGGNKSIQSDAILEEEEGVEGEEVG
ncbi:hypothetical protein PF005_g19390 [Phytophthora fragariae]|uniref:EF-hand domain-containing protein n=1 Tax=Phytophthora fragariae TaxID=53985 RepID=A0A6A3WZ88_9STRA|nr:hypothetical protein PF005_g19390 [Phytophthora fragariae]